MEKCVFMRLNDYLVIFCCWTCGQHLTLWITVCCFHFHLNCPLMVEIVPLWQVSVCQHQQREIFSALSISWSPLRVCFGLCVIPNGYRTTCPGYQNLWSWKVTHKGVLWSGYANLCVIKTRPLLLYGCPKYPLRKLQYVQNTAAQAVSKIGKFHPIAPVLIGCHWLPVNYCIIFKVYK